MDRAREYNWSTWVGTTRNPYSITLHGFIEREKSDYVSLNLNGRTRAYMASYADEWNPNHIKASDFNIYVGNSVNECEEFVWRRMEDFRRRYGDPPGTANHLVGRHISNQEVMELSKYMMRKFSWYQGEEPVS